MEEIVREHNDCEQRKEYITVRSNKWRVTVRIRLKKQSNVL